MPAYESFLPAPGCGALGVVLAGGLVLVFLAHVPPFKAGF